MPSALLLAKAYTSPAVALSLRFLPRLAKLVAYLLIILNIRSLPFAWHSMLPRYSIRVPNSMLIAFMSQSTCFGPLPRLDGVRGVPAFVPSLSPLPFAKLRRASSLTT